MERDYLFTSESVSEGHPDKMADQVSDAVLDAIFKQDPNGHVACETLLTENKAVVAGEFKAKKGVKFDVEAIVRETAKHIGYCDAACGFDYKTCDVENLMHGQSANIDEAVEKRATEVEIIPGKGSGALKKHVLRFLDQKEIKVLYHRVEKDSTNFGRVFVHFRWK